MSSGRRIRHERRPRHLRVGGHQTMSRFASLAREYAGGASLKSCDHMWDLLPLRRDARGLRGDGRPCGWRVEARAREPRLAKKNKRKKDTQKCVCGIRKARAPNTEHRTCALSTIHYPVCSTQYSPAVHDPERVRRGHDAVVPHLRRVQFLQPAFAYRNVRFPGAQPPAHREVRLDGAAPRVRQRWARGAMGAGDEHKVRNPREAIRLHRRFERGDGGRRGESESWSWRWRVRIQVHLGNSSCG